MTTCVCLMSDEDWPRAARFREVTFVAYLRPVVCNRDGGAVAPSAASSHPSCCPSASSPPSTRDARSPGAAAPGGLARGRGCRQGQQQSRSITHSWGRLSETGWAGGHTKIETATRFHPMSGALCLRVGAGSDGGDRQCTAGVLQLSRDELPPHRTILHISRRAKRPMGQMAPLAVACTGSRRTHAACWARPRRSCCG
jgi:hypothetical protein